MRATCLVAVAVLELAGSLGLAQPAPQQQGDTVDRLAQVLQGRRLEDPAMLSRLERVASQLVPCMERRDLQLTLGLADPMNLNAITDSVSTLVVTQGLMEATRDDDGVLAWVVGHELGHMDRSEHCLLGNLLGGLADQVAGDSTLGKLASSLLGARLDQHEEYRADERGLRYMLTAGYAPEGALRAMQRFLAVYGTGIGVDSYFQAHPPNAKRLANLQAELPQVILEWGHQFPAVRKPRAAIAQASGLRQEGFCEALAQLMTDCGQMEAQAIAVRTTSGLADATGASPACAPKAAVAQESGVRPGDLAGRVAQLLTQSGRMTAEPLALSPEFVVKWASQLATPRKPRVAVAKEAGVRDADVCARLAQLLTQAGQMEAQALTLPPEADLSTSTAQAAGAGCDLLLWCQVQPHPEKPDKVVGTLASVHDVATGLLLVQTTIPGDKLDPKAAALALQSDSGREGAMLQAHAAGFEQLVWCERQFNPEKPGKVVGTTVCVVETATGRLVTQKVVVGEKPDPRAVALVLQEGDDTETEAEREACLLQARAGGGFELLVWCRHQLDPGRPGRLGGTAVSVFDLPTGLLLTEKACAGDKVEPKEVALALLANRNWRHGGGLPL